MASTPSVIFIMSRVPLLFIISLMRGSASRNQVMSGEGFPKALQLSVSEDMFPAASVAKTTVSCGSVLNLGGMLETAWEEVTAELQSYQVSLDACRWSPTPTLPSHSPFPLPSPFPKFSLPSPTSLLIYTYTSACASCGAYICERI